MSNLLKDFIVVTGLGLDVCCDKIWIIVLRVSLAVSG